VWSFSISIQAMLPVFNLFHSSRTCEPQMDDLRETCYKRWKVSTHTSEQRRRGGSKHKRALLPVSVSMYSDFV
jgi:hypothetical protein